MSRHYSAQLTQRVIRLHPSNAGSTLTTWKHTSQDVLPWKKYMINKFIVLKGDFRWLFAIMIFWSYWFCSSVRPCCLSQVQGRPIWLTGTV